MADILAQLVHLAVGSGFLEINELLADNRILGLFGGTLSSGRFIDLVLEVHDIRMLGERSTRGHQFIELVITDDGRNALDLGDWNEVVLVVLDRLEEEIDIFIDLVLIHNGKCFFLRLLLRFGECEEGLDLLIQIGKDGAALPVHIGEFHIERRAGHGAVGEVDLHGLAIIEEREHPFPAFHVHPQEGILVGLSLHLESSVGNNGTVDGRIADSVNQENTGAVDRRVDTRNVILGTVSGAGQRKRSRERQHKNSSFFHIRFGFIVSVLSCLPPARVPAPACVPSSRAGTGSPPDPPHPIAWLRGASAARR